MFLARSVGTPWDPVVVRHARAVNAREHVKVPLFAGAVFVLTLVVASLRLPPQIAMYYSPTDHPDVVYQAWQYLFLVPLGTLLLAFALASGAGALMAAFGPGGATIEGRVMAWVGAWVLVSASAAVWVAISLGNGHPLQRSWLEALIGLALFLGAFAIIAVAFVRAPHRATKELP
jgi:hypothetical protein